MSTIDLNAVVVGLIGAFGLILAATIPALFSFLSYRAAKSAKEQTDTGNGTSIATYVQLVNDKVDILSVKLDHHNSDDDRRFHQIGEALSELGADVVVD